MKKLKIFFMGIFSHFPTLSQICKYSKNHIKSIYVYKKAYKKPRKNKKKA